MLLLQAGQDALAVEDVSALQLKRRSVLQTDAADVVEFCVVQTLEPPPRLKLHIGHLFRLIFFIGFWSFLLLLMVPPEPLAAKHIGTAVPGIFQAVIKATTAASTTAAGHADDKEDSA
jgi:hypothetical protein